MNLLEFGRSMAYWLSDALHGKRITQNLKLLENCESGIWSDEEIEAHQKKAVNALLTHARKTVPAYKNMTSDFLSDWPVTNKLTYKSSPEDYLSTSYNKENLIKMTTSGSTGTPFTSYQNGNKKRHVNAEVAYYNGKAGYKIGKRIIYLRSVVGEMSKSRFKQFMQNIYLIDCTDLSDAGIKKTLNEIKRYSKHGGAMLMGYGSTFELFQKYFNKHGYEEASGCKIYGVVSGSVMLYDNTRESVEKAFGCKCFSRYANEENGFIGQDEIKNNVFLNNRANYKIEILKFDTDIPVDDGEIGRIVITDFYNYSMPMIRYDTGDVGAWEQVESYEKKRMAIGSFGGRILDMLFDCEGNQVSPHSISTRMWKFQQVDQYQLIQKTKTEYELRLNLSKDSAIDEASVLAAFLEVLGKSARIKVTYCDEIPVLSSGKRRYIVNEMLKKQS